MNVNGVEFFISLITLVMAYVIAVSFSGAARAWVARAFGDDTAESLGLLTLNPLAHIDFLGGIFLIFFGFGWGRNVPINPYKIHDPLRRFKIAFAYLSNTIAHLIMASLVCVSLVFAFGRAVLDHAALMVYTGRILQSQFAHAYPDSSSFAIALGLVGIALIFLNVLLSVLDFIISLFSLLSFTVLEHSPSYKKYRDVLIIVIPMMMIYLFINPLRLLVVRLLFFVGEVLARLFGGF